MYFKQLPYTQYQIGGVRKLVTNILTRIAVSSEIRDNVFIYEEYTVRDGETPESVAFDFYGSTQYHWVIMVINDIVYPWNDWALSTTTLNKIAREKYGNDEEIYDPHHYLDSNGFITNQTSGTYPVSNLQYEIEENDKKRNIKILSPQLISLFVKDFRALIKQA